jgi:hypothetical protein
LKLELCFRLIVKVPTLKTFMQHPTAVEFVKASVVLVDRAAVEVTGFSVLHPLAVMVVVAATVSVAGGATVNRAAGFVVPMPTEPN